MRESVSKQARPEDCATAWFAVLERARMDGDEERAARAMRELSRLEVVVGFVPASGKEVPDAR